MAQALRNTPIQEVCNELNRILGTKHFHIQDDVIKSFEQEEEGQDISIVQLQDGSFKFSVTGLTFMTKNIVGDTISFIEEL